MQRNKRKQKSEAARAPQGLAPPPALLDALGYGLDEGAKPLVALPRDMQEAVERSLADLEQRILEAAKQDFDLPWTLLQTLPGTGPLAAATLLAEVGEDM